MTDGIREHHDYRDARDLLEVMVDTHQLPDTEDVDAVGNLNFVRSVGEHLAGMGAEISTVDDPEHNNRKLLVAAFGDPNGRQLVANISHSDVVASNNQPGWQTDPQTLTEQDGLWIARGVSDTHGSGVSMVLACLNAELQEALRAKGMKIDVIFTHDEEAADSYWSFRGARVATGLEGVDPVATGDFFIAGEPTERADISGMIPRRAHKGRYLIKCTMAVEGAGHAAEGPNNALRDLIGLGAEVVRLGSDLQSLPPSAEAAIFSPPHSSTEPTAAEVKNDALLTTPSTASFVFDIRTLPGKHDDVVCTVKEIVATFREQNPGVDLSVDRIDSFAGTTTDANSPIVIAAEQATGNSAVGFNGGDEGEVMRRIGMQGVTLGPGAMTEAHAANEKIRIESIFEAVVTYRAIYRHLLRGAA